MSKTWGIDRWRLGIIFLAAALRVYRLGPLTEFLGDQGRTMLVMRRFIEEGAVPLSGPSTLSGHNLGPMFYYLLAPGYIIWPDPVGVSLWVALLGVFSVFVLYSTVRMMFGVVPARVVSILWAVSPVIISADRVIWEPNLVPLFSLLFTYLLYKAYQSWDMRYWMAAGISIGVLVQLHYPDIYFVGLIFLSFAGAWILRKKSLRMVVLAGAWSTLGFCLALAPFLWHQYTVGFRDITGIASIIAAGSGMPLGKRAMVWQALDYSYRVLGRMLPDMSRIPAAVILMFWGLFILLRPTLKNIFFFVWFIGGITAMVRYSGVVHDHYLYFLIPAPYLAFAGVISTMRGNAEKVVISIIASVVLFQFMHTDIADYGTNDIWRVSNAVRQIQKDSGGSNFSFTLIGTRSFSDMHYRYYMTASGLKPSPAVGTAHGKLYVVCESIRCPTVTEITSMPELPVLCFDDHCKGSYPEIPLREEWSYVRHERISADYRTSGRIYIFERRR